MIVYLKMHIFNVGLQMSFGLEHLKTDIAAELVFRFQFCLHLVDLEEDSLMMNTSEIRIPINEPGQSSTDFKLRICVISSLKF